MNIISKILFGYHGAGIVFTSDDECLMQLRKHPPVWAFIGGGAKKGESSVDTALREFYEETGVQLNENDLDVKPLHTLGFGRFRWVLYHCHKDYKIDPTHGNKAFKEEYVNYKYFHINSYKKELKAEKHKRTFFFVTHQMRLLKKRLGLRNNKEF